MGGIGGKIMYTIFVTLYIILFLVIIRSRQNNVRKTLEETRRKENGSS